MKLRTLAAGAIVGVVLCSIVAGAVVLSAQDAIDRALGSRHG